MEDRQLVLHLAQGKMKQHRWNKVEEECAYSALAVEAVHLQLLIVNDFTTDKH